ncbi:MAG: TnpV protein [Clostridia bacterium]|nr:TnpV protein [Clostridia bacterium]
MSELRYVRCGDYLIPDLTLNVKVYPPLGKYGRMREKYLREHRHLLYSTMLLGGRLDEHLHEIDVAARKRMDQLMRQMAETAGITEELKACDPMRWVGEMNAIKMQAEEMILEELIYN